MTVLHIPNPAFRAFDASGNPLSGGKVYTYEAGTTTPKLCYKDSSKSANHTNPIILDSAGYAPGYEVWFDGTYKIVLKDSSDVTIFTFDDISSTSVSGTGDIDVGVLNGSFEVDDNADGTPDNWTIVEVGTFTYDSTDSAHGAKSIKFTSSGSGGGTATSDFLTCSDLHSYSLHFSIKSSVADVRNTVEILYYDKDQVYISNIVFYDNSTTNPTSWTNYQLFSSSVTPTGAKYLKVKLTGCHSSDATAGSTWFDNIELHAEESRLVIGNPGTEGTGINVNGTTFESQLKVSDIDGTNYAQTILHRHSTTLEPVIVGARSYSNTSSHTDVPNGTGLFTIYGVGYAGSNYKIFGSISIAADSTGTVSNTSAPGKVVINVTPDSSTTPAAAVTITNDKKTTFGGVISIPDGAVSAPALTNTGDTDTGIYFPAADSVSIATGGASNVYVNANGNTGINITPSAWKSTYGVLQVGYSSAIFGNKTTSNVTWITDNTYIDSGDNFTRINSGYAAAIAVNVSGEIYFNTAGTSTAGSAITFTERARVTNDGYLRLASKGIQFNGDTADANSLDDYEEGTWTPALTFGGGSTGVTHTTQTGVYTKIGNVVTASFIVQLSSTGSASGQARVSLPVAANASAPGSGSLYHANLTAAVSTVYGLTTLSAATAELRYNGVTTSSALNETHFGSGNAYISGTIVYLV